MRTLITGIAAVLAIASTATAGEPTLALLRELVQPHSSAASRLHMHSDGRQDIPSSLFTLEELHDSRSGLLDDLDLTDEARADDIPLAMNDQVNYFINYFQTKARNTYARWLTRSARYLPMMKEILRKEGLPDELVYVAMIESGFHLHARSVANAVGPWQFMSATGRRYSLRIDQWVDERKDPVKATMAAALYFKDLYGMFNNDWYLAAAGYNAGENKIFRAINKYETDDFWELAKGTYLKRETKEYVPKLLAATIIAKDPDKYGFTEIAAVPLIEFDTVTVDSRTDLELVARLTGTTYQTIKELNPALRHWCTPPNYPDYELKIPKGTGDLFLQGIAVIPEEQRFSEKKLYSRYKAGKRDTLKLVAKRFGLTAGELADLNSIGRTTKIVGKTLVIPARHSADFAHEGTGRPVITARRTADAPPAIQYYTIQKGDTLYGLARRFKVSTKLLTAWNDLKITVTLVPGKRLIVAKNNTSSRNS